MTLHGQEYHISKFLMQILWIYTIVEHVASFTEITVGRKYSCTVLRNFQIKTAICIRENSPFVWPTYIHVSQN